MASRREYTNTTEVAELIGGSPTITDLQISEAEELIDSYVGAQDKFVGHVVDGRFASVAGATQMTLDPLHQNNFDKDYFKGCEIEIIGGVGAGQRRKITTNTKEGVITTDSFSTAPDSTSYYKIYQLGKFPRECDAFFNSNYTPSIWLKSIPEAVKRAVAAQVEFMIEMGDDYFQGDAADMTAEKIGDYSYEKGTSSSGATGQGIHKLIAPKAKLLLRGFVNRKGVITY